MSCGNTPTISFTGSDAQLVVGDHVQTSNAKVTTATAYARGDLLILSDVNVLTLATDPKIWNVIAVETITAAQATAMAAAGTEYAVYNQGEFDVTQCSLGGVKLTAGAQQTNARARGTMINIELRKVGG